MVEVDIEMVVIIKMLQSQTVKEKDCCIYKVVTKRIKDFSKYQIGSVRDEVFIYQKYKNDIWIPSKLTSYLKTACSDVSISTKTKYGGWVCQFLNFISNEIELGFNKIFKPLKKEGLYGLNFYHLAEYLNSFRNTNSYSTVVEKESALLMFYDYLYQMGITGESAKVEKIPVPVKSGHKRKQVVWQIVNPFEGNHNYVLEYPSTERVHSKVLKDMDEDVWMGFVKYAEKEYSHIALGVLLQICGGLRQGEVVNLTRKSATLHRNSGYIDLDIDDRQDILFNDRSIDTRYSQVKKIRENQPVFNFNGELFEMWDKHIEYLDNCTNKKNNDALFLDARGNAMTAQVYQKEFHKLKWEYIVYLEKEEGKAELADKLKISHWGSHIGRHIFTNYLIKKGYIKNIMGYSDPKLLMILRGDSSAKSAEAYLDLHAITKCVATEIQNMSEIALSVASTIKQQQGGN